jgi:glycosyltransferase involved in cell wall biosynthesis
MPFCSLTLESLDLRPKFTTGATVFPSRKDRFVQRSLSVLLPVKDAQASLTASVHEILDLGTDSGGPFELLIIDDGSTDATGEVAHELTHHYPQIRVFRHTTPLGQEAAVSTGLRWSRGDVVVVRDEKGVFRVVDRGPADKMASSRPNRPNYLSRLKKFVLSE